VVPVVAQFCSASRGNEIFFAVFFNGRPFRDEEAARLAAAPYAVIRIDARREVIYANDAAARLFSYPAEQLLGSSFPELFDVDFRHIINDALSRSFENQRVALVEVSFSTARGGKRHQVQLSLTSDRAPGRVVLGAVVMIQSLDIANARHAINQIAISRADWRTRLKDVLQELRSFVAFDGGTFGIYTEDIGLFKWLYIEPGSPNSWAGHWVVLDDQVKSWIIGGKTWAADLRQFVDFHPYLSNDPIVQQHLAWNDRAFITLPVIGPKGPTSSLSLVSKLPNVYSEETLDFLKELDLERVLMIFENDAAEERREFCSKC
jgi:PAS domain S-box-containing protein